MTWSKMKREASGEKINSDLSCISTGSTGSPPCEVPTGNFAKKKNGQKRETFGQRATGKSGKIRTFSFWHRLGQLATGKGNGQLARAFRGICDLPEGPRIGSGNWQRAEREMKEFSEYEFWELSERRA